MGCRAVAELAIGVVSPTTYVVAQGIEKNAVVVSVRRQCTAVKVKLRSAKSDSDGGRATNCRAVSQLTKSVISPTCHGATCTIIISQNNAAVITVGHDCGIPDVARGARYGHRTGSAGLRAIPKSAEVVSSPAHGAGREACAYVRKSDGDSRKALGRIDRHRNTGIDHSAIAQLAE